MKKEFEIKLTGSTTSYLSDKVAINCSFAITDPEAAVDSNPSPNPFIGHLGTYSVMLDFPLGSDPSKSEILAKVSKLNGVTV